MYLVGWRTGSLVTQYGDKNLNWQDTEPWLEAMLTNQLILQEELKISIRQTSVKIRLWNYFQISHVSIS